MSTPGDSSPSKKTSSTDSVSTRSTRSRSPSPSPSLSASTSLSVSTTSTGTVTPTLGRSLFLPILPSPSPGTGSESSSSSSSSSISAEPEPAQEPGSYLPLDLRSFLLTHTSPIPPSLSVFGVHCARLYIALRKIRDIRKALNPLPTATVAVVDEVREMPKKIIRNPISIGFGRGSVGRGLIMPSSPLLSSLIGGQFGLDGGAGAEKGSKTPVLTGTSSVNDDILALNLNDTVGSKTTQTHLGPQKPNPSVRSISPRPSPQPHDPAGVMNMNLELQELLKEIKGLLVKMDYELYNVQHAPQKDDVVYALDAIEWWREDIQDTVRAISNLKTQAQKEFEERPPKSHSRGKGKEPQAVGLEGVDSVTSKADPSKCPGSTTLTIRRPPSIYNYNRPMIDILSSIPTMRLLSAGLSPDAVWETHETWLRLAGIRDPYAHALDKSALPAHGHPHPSPQPQPPPPPAPDSPARPSTSTIKGTAGAKSPQNFATKVWDTVSNWSGSIRTPRIASAASGFGLFGSGVGSVAGGHSRGGHHTGVGAEGRIGSLQERPGSPVGDVELEWEGQSTAGGGMVRRWLDGSDSVGQHYRSVGIASASSSNSVRSGITSIRSPRIRNTKLRTKNQTSAFPRNTSSGSLSSSIWSGGAENTSTADAINDAASVNSIISASSSSTIREVGSRRNSGETRWSI